MKARLPDLREPETVRDLDIFELMMTTGIRGKIQTGKRIFQVAYDEVHLSAQSRLLRLLGYGVTSIFGNEAAKIVLRGRPHYDLFVIGHAAPEQTRIEFLHWLRAIYPEAKILALNAPQDHLQESDYNASYDEPGSWLPLVAAVAA